MDVDSETPMGSGTGIFPGFSLRISDFSPHLLAVDDARRHEPEAGEYDGMDVDGEMTMARACGIFLFSFIIQLQCLIIY